MALFLRLMVRHDKKVFIGFKGHGARPMDIA